MRLRTIVDEDFVNFKLPSMFIGTVFCNGKCCTEANLPLSVCQNDGWRKSAVRSMEDCDIIQRYIANPITKAIVFGGLEPFDQYQELFRFIACLRMEYGKGDPVVIYTGYNRDEIEGEVMMLSQFDNIIIKFGRYIPGHTPHYDDVLGVNLASDNQYAAKIG